MTRRAKTLFVSAAFVATAMCQSAGLVSGATITAWTFETLPPSASVTAGPYAAEVGTGSALGFHSNAAAAYSSPVGNGSTKSFSANNWLVGDYWQFTAPTTGFKDITLTFDETSSSTGPKEFKVQYAVGAGSFIDVPSSIANYQYNAQINAAPNTPWSGGGSQNPVYTVSLTLSSLTSLNDQGSVSFRLVGRSTVSAGGGTVATTGTDRVDNVIIGGNPLVAVAELTWAATSGTDFRATNAFVNGVTPTTFTDGSNTTFDNTTAGTITVNSDVAPGNMKVTGGTHTFSGSGTSINGSGSVSFTGGETTLSNVVLNFSSGFSLNAGARLLIADDTFFTASSTTVLPLSGGTIVATGGFSSNRDYSAVAGTSVFDTGANDVQLGRLAAGAGTFVKTGSGTLNLTGFGTSAISVIGGLQILGGNIVVSHGGTPSSVFTYNFGNFTAGTMIGNLDIREPSRINIDGGTLSGGGKILLSNTAGSLTTYSIATDDALTNVNATVTNEIVINADNSIGDGSFVLNLLANDGPGTGTSTGNLTVGVISGNGGVNLAVGPVGGSGTLTLAGASTYTGPTTVNSGAFGVVKLGVNNALPITTSLTFNTVTDVNVSNVPTPFNGPGSVDLNGHNQQLVSIETGTGNGIVTGNIGASGGRIVNSGAVATLTVSNNSGNTITYAGVLSGPINLTKGGNYAQVLSGTFAATGELKVNAGSLTIPANSQTDAYRTLATPALITTSGTAKLVAPAPAAATFPGVVVTGDLNVGVNAPIDLTGNDMVLTGTFAPFVRASIRSWFLNSAVGLGSSTADKTLTTLVMFSNNGGGVPFYSTYDGVTLDSDDFIIKYSYVGDTNVDGVLNGVDASNIIEAISTGVYSYSADTNFDGVVNAADWAAFSTALSNYSTPLGNGQGGGTGGGSVPEPTALGLVLAALPLVSRRRR